MSSYDFVVKSANKGPNGMDGRGNAIQRLAEYAVSTRFTDIPSEVVDHARHILLDTIGVALGGSTTPEATALAHRVGRQDGGPSTIIGHALRSSTFNAVLVNGTAATWMDYDSGHRPPPGKPLLAAPHLPIHLIPASLAVGEARASSGAELLAALVVGYDAGARIGLAIRIRPEIHCHGTHTNVAAAVAAARLKGFDRQQMELTIGLAAHLTLMPSWQNAYQGRTVRNTYAAVGSALGILASELATAGFSPEYDAIRSVYGGVISPWLDPARITEDLGKRYEITLGFIKPYPMCRFGHPAIEAAQELIRYHPIDPEEIETVTVETFDLAATCNENLPKTDLAAKFSVPWAVASMLVKKSAGPDEFRNEALTDPMVKAISARVVVKEDPKYTAMTPGKRPASVTVKTKKGTIFNREVQGSAGGPDAPMPTEKIQEKFSSLAEPVLGREQASAVVDMIASLHKLPDIHRLTRLLMPMSGGSK